MGCDVVFVGGGVIGLAAAWRAAASGLTATVVDPSPGHGATWAAAGMLAPVTEAHYGEEDLTRLLVAGAERWPAFAGDLEAAAGDAIGYERCGTVSVAADASDRAVIDELLELQRGLGLDAVRLSSSECRSAVPALSPGVRGGASFAGDHQVDNRKLVAALLAASARAGVVQLAGTVAVVRTADGAACGVELDDGRAVDAGAVVLCAGCRSGMVGGLSADVLPPVRPVKGHILRLRNRGNGAPLLTRTVRALVHGRTVYAVPRRDGSLVVGATVEEQGFDRTVRAGAVHALLDDARAVLPGIDELELAECTTGLRPGSPDNAPVVGRSEVDRLVVATGHYRNGILLAPLTADAVLALLSGGDPPGPLAPFGPGRFRSQPEAANGTVRARS